MSARSTSREENARLEKHDRHIRSAWGVVKRAMHPWEPRKGNTPSDHRTKTWVPVVEVSLAERWSHASLVDDHCVRREVRSQAVRERRSRLDLATVFSRFTPAMRGTTEAAANGSERLDSRGRIRIRVSTESQDIVRDTAEGVLRW